MRVTVDEWRLKALSDRCGVPVPLVKIMPGGDHHEGGIVRGDYDRTTGRIRLFLDLDGKLEASRLIYVNSSLVFTFLHEFRHHIQQHTWTPEQWAEDALRPYHLKEQERDANSWADIEKAGNRGLIHVKRVFHGSGMSRLAKTEKGVRNA